MVQRYEKNFFATNIFRLFIVSTLIFLPFHPIFDILSDEMIVSHPQKRKNFHECTGNSKIMVTFARK